jgi:hypothetical protein
MKIFGEALKTQLNTHLKTLYKGVDINNWDNIPFLEKRSIKNNIIEFKNNKMKNSVNYRWYNRKTCRFFQSNSVLFKEIAFVYSFFKKNGFESPNLKASLRGTDFSLLKNREFWIFKPHHYEINFSPFHINRDTIHIYVEQLNKLKPKHFHDYLSSFYL